MSLKAWDWRAGTEWLSLKSRKRCVATKGLEPKAWVWWLGSEVLRLEACNWRVVDEGFGLSLCDQRVLQRRICDRRFGTEILELKRRDWRLITGKFVTEGAERLQLKFCDWRVGTEAKELGMNSWDWKVGTEGLQLKGWGLMAVDDGADTLRLKVSN